MRRWAWMKRRIPLIRLLSAQGLSTPEMSKRFSKESTLHVDLFFLRSSSTRTSATGFSTASSAATSICLGLMRWGST